MAHDSRLSKIVIDAPPADHDRELAFWNAATGQDIGLLIQRLDDGRARVHIDVHTDDVPAEVARLEKLGAERAGQAHSWQLMRDPAGLVFCVIPERPGELNDSNARRWD